MEADLKITGDFMKAKLELDAARDELAKATTAFIDAERRYNKASRAYAARYLEQSVK
jgi:hypothetical protein